MPTIPMPFSITVMMQAPMTARVTLPTPPVIALPPTITAAIAGSRKVAAEVGKYTVKDGDLLGDGSDVIGRVATLDPALKGRRLFAWGGALKTISQQVLSQGPEAEEDLVRITGEDHGPNCPVCGTEMLEHVYRWMQAERHYVG